MQYDASANPLNKYKVRNLVASLIDSEHFPKFIAITGVIAIIVHQIF